jgi:hypothetical protein
VALSFAVLAAGAVGDASANRPPGAEFKKLAAKKVAKAVKRKLPRSNVQGLVPSEDPIKIKVTSCKQKLRGHRVAAFKCSWNAHGELPGRVLLRCQNTAKFLVAKKKVAKRGTKCKNLIETMSPLLADRHPVTFGYFEDFTTIPGLFDEAAAGGAQMVREGITWKALQPTPDPDPANWNWSDFDDFYNEALANGLQPVFTLRNAPCWAAPQPCGSGPTYPAPEHIGDFATVASEVAQRYPQLHAIEIWFEPNGPAGSANPDPVIFSQLVKAGADAIHAVGNGIPVWSGGLAPGMASSEKIEYPVFLDQALDAGGVQSADAIGFHAVTETTFQPGRDPTASYLGRQRIQAQYLQTALADHGVDKPIVFSQLSYSSAAGEYTEAEQAEAYAASLELTEQMPGVTDVIIARLLDNGDGDKVSGFGVLRADLSPKPAYCAIADVRGVPAPPGC